MPSTRYREGGFWNVWLAWVVRKAKMVVGALSRLLPNVGGSTASKRSVLCSVVHGILLYGAEAWIDGYRIQKYGLCVLSAVPPLDLVAEERLCECQRRKK